MLKTITKSGVHLPGSWAIHLDVQWAGWSRFPRWVERFRCIVKDRDDVPYLSLSHYDRSRARNKQEHKHVLDRPPLRSVLSVLVARRCPRWDLDGRSPTEEVITARVCSICQGNSGGPAWGMKLGFLYVRDCPNARRRRRLGPAISGGSVEGNRGQRLCIRRTS